MPPEEWKSVAWIWLLSPSSDFLIRSLGYQLSAAHASVTVDIEPRETLHYRSSIWCCHTSCQPDCLESTCSSPSVRVKWCEIHTNGGSLCYKYEWMNEWLTDWLTDWLNEWTTIELQQLYVNHSMQIMCSCTLQSKSSKNMAWQKQAWSSGSMLNLAWQTCSVTSLNP